MTPLKGIGEATRPPPTYDAPLQRGICRRHRSVYAETLDVVVVLSVVWLEWPGSARRWGHALVKFHVGGGNVGGGVVDPGDGDATG